MKLNAEWQDGGGGKKKEIQKHWHSGASKWGTLHPKGTQDNPIKPRKKTDLVSGFVHLKIN